ncbi:hypothetical protein PoB_000751700 [Plakobranchus ocellatus]|uniref:Uncharacterized protein n=1 Tax=Plakobranchus ocellatus TaxID=259542 RepID=A0AAV3YEY6_9GAST|nr:hypothetical protein PoB_000751700 [Plakobranchus ocellatus]
MALPANEKEIMCTCTSKYPVYTFCVEWPFRRAEKHKKGKAGKGGGGEESQQLFHGSELIKQIEQQLQIVCKGEDSGSRTIWNSYQQPNYRDIVSMAAGMGDIKSQKVENDDSTDETHVKTTDDNLPPNIPGAERIDDSTSNVTDDSDPESENLDRPSSFERRLICQEVENILVELSRIACKTYPLSRNEGHVIDCGLLKQLSQETSAKKIDDTIDKINEWAERLRTTLKEHVDSHRFIDKRDNPGRRSGKKKEIPTQGDSGIYSAEVSAFLMKPVHAIESLKEANIDDGVQQRVDPSSPDSDETSVECNLCCPDGKHCTCQPQREKEADQNSKRQAILLSSSQLPPDCEVSQMEPESDVSQL